MIELDVEARRLTWLVSDDEVARRRAAYQPPAERWTRGYHQLFSKHVTQANEGCDFDFLEGRSAGQEPDIF